MAETLDDLRIGISIRHARHIITSLASRLQGEEAPTSLLYSAQEAVLISSACFVFAMGQGALDIRGIDQKRKSFSIANLLSGKESEAVLLEQKTGLALLEFSDCPFLVCTKDSTLVALWGPTRRLQAKNLVIAVNFSLDRIDLVTYLPQPEKRSFVDESVTEFGIDWDILSRLGNLLR